LQEGAVQVETREPNTLSRAGFPLVSLVDNPIVNNFSTVPGVSEQHVPITTALVGERVVIGGASYPRHFWLATYVESASAQDVWLTLPRFTVNGVATSPPRVHFRRRTVLAVAVFNC
jgi:hypothetical protein